MTPLEHHQYRVNGFMEQIRYYITNEQALDMLDNLEMALQDLEGETNRIVDEMQIVEERKVIHGKRKGKAA